MQGLVNPYFAGSGTLDVQPATGEGPPRVSGDERARFAWRAAVLGFFFLPGVLHVYSFILLVRLSLEEPALSRRGLHHFYGALLIDILVIGFAAFVLLPVFR